MSLHLILAFFLLIWTPSPETESDPQFHVYFFLLEDCKITTAYIPEIKKILKDFQSTPIEFKSVFSNPSSHPDSVYQFLDQYALSMDVIFDEDQQLAKRFKITVMPEVVVLNLKSGKMIYQGRIDNLFASLGKKRARATTRDLRDCLNQLQQGRIPEFRKTEAVGCFLEGSRI
ncbi:MAG: redoxin domain-containing protein [Saprospiraceae bacterium]|nr:redoxin domain-containing protein [Saprospiraceae bacterium]